MLSLRKVSVLNWKTAITKRSVLQTCGGTSKHPFKHKHYRWYDPDRKRLMPPGIVCRMKSKKPS
jgi:hypothetical protein